MIDKIKAQEEFKKYVTPYDVTNKKIALKIAHTYRTATVAEEIAQSLKLSKDDVELAWLIGLLHDIGRFEQLRIYDTFNDRESIDHAMFGAKLLFEDRLIESFIEDRKYDDIIYQAVRNHNKFEIEEGLNDKELLHAKIIRDADKTDIFEIEVKDIESEKGFLFDKELLKKQKITPKVYEDFLEHRSTNKKDMKNEMDHFVEKIAFIYGYYYKRGLEIVKEKKYIQRMFTVIDGCENEEIQMQNETIKKIALDYLEDRLK